MIGAIIGDIAGSRFERHNHKSKEFEMFDRKCRVTDDSVMSIAVARAILECDGNYDDLSKHAVTYMQGFGRVYKNAGYGRSFIDWIFDEEPRPYNSYGNGSAMRVGPCGYAANSIEEAKELSKKVTEVTHNHPEGLKGAEAVAVAIFLARDGKNKEEIKEYIDEHYYKVDFTIDQIRDEYTFDVTCQGSVPVAFAAFYDSTDFEDAVRTAISAGGDSDTIGAITGSIAEAYYGVPEGMVYSAIDYLDSCQMENLYYFEKAYSSKALDENGEPTIEMFDVLDSAVDKVIPKGTDIEITEELSDGLVKGYVDKSVMRPDFSSFDKHDLKDDALEVIEKAGDGILKTAQRAGEGLASFFNQIKESADKEEKEVSSTRSQYDDNSILEMFGLNYEQSLLMFSAQKLIAENDVNVTKDEKKAETKTVWIKEWEQSIKNYLEKIDSEKDNTFFTREQLQERFKILLEESENKTWYYIIALELMTFMPYTALGGDNDKLYARCRYDEKKGDAFAAELLLEHKCLSEEKIMRLDRVYSKSMAEISGKAGKLVSKIAIVVAVAGVAAALAAIGAGPIAVILFGAQFEGLSGAALVSACLALAGGGAVAIGGSGMLGGVITIAGGGALLGLAGGGTAMGIGTAVMMSAPDYTLTQAAKLETILKEVILNAQQDVVSAQKIIGRYQNQIEELNKQLTALEIQDEKNRKEIKNIKTSIKYLTKSCKDMNKFASAYEIGLQSEEGSQDGER